MGMFNEVFKKCPSCHDGVGYLQIHQIVLGFGGFNLDDPSTLEELSVEELRELRGTLETEKFWCKAPGHTSYGDDDTGDADVCGRSFRFMDRKQTEERQKLIDELTRNKSE